MAETTSFNITNFIIILIPKQDIFKNGSRRAAQEVNQNLHFAQTSKI